MKYLLSIFLSLFLTSCSPTEISTQTYQSSCFREQSLLSLTKITVYQFNYQDGCLHEAELFLDKTQAIYNYISSGNTETLSSEIKTALSKVPETVEFTVISFTGIGIDFSSIDLPDARILICIRQQFENPECTQQDFLVKIEEFRSQDFISVNLLDVTGIEFPIQINSNYSEILDITSNMYSNAIQLMMTGVPP